MREIDRDRTRWFLRNILPHEGALRRWLARGTPLGLEADDIIQETYAVLADLASVDQIRHPRAYLFQVARSVITRHVRRARVVSIHSVEDFLDFDPADDRPSPEQLAIDRDQLGWLAKAIGGMPAKTREAFVLRRVEGLSQREISARMAISENTVEKHISRGLRLLGDWLGHGGNAIDQTSREPGTESRCLDGRIRNQSTH